MRISIWQQWASNHSAAFTLMGKFQTVEEAQRVGNILKDMLTQIARSKQTRREYDLDPTEVERQYAEQYGVSWPTTIEYARDPATAPQVVMIADRVVIVAEDFIDRYTWTGPAPFGELLEKLGAEVAACVEGSSGLIQVTIRCAAPDEETADALMDEVQTGERDSWAAGSIRIDNLAPEGNEWESWIRGQVTRDGLQFTYTYAESSHGRYFANLLAYLQVHGCKDIDYDFGRRP